MAGISVLPWAVGAGGMLGLMGAEDAEAAPAVKDFAKKYAKAVADGDKKLMYAGSLEPDVFDAALKRDDGVQNNRVFIGAHGGEARLATGEMEPEELGRHIENMLNSSETRVLPNFPSLNFRNNAKNMLYLDDGKDFVAPFISGKSGDIVLKTAFEPQKDRKKFIEAYLGRPNPPISGLGDESASAQPQGLSAVRQASTAKSIRGLDALRNLKKSPLIGAAVLGTPQDANGSSEPTFTDRALHNLGLGTRNVLTGLGRGATFGMSDPGKVIADVIGLPAPKTDTDKTAANITTGIMEAIPAVMGGAGMARMAASPVVRGVGRTLSENPNLDLVLGGLLGHFLGNAE